MNQIDEHIIMTLLDWLRDEGLLQTDLTDSDICERIETDGIL